ncbi:GGDEF domain-containing protein [Nitrincola sp. MINF-07-Sa-05]|uniref:GGDEF domain-containing protein n=1 Tax=Nitrincola salilacus TaxID=3400273 RepID=UPI003917C652
MLSYMELLTARQHTRYFRETRGHYIYRRTRVIALILALLQSVWILVDHMLLPVDVQSQVAVARLLSSVAFVALVCWTQRPYSEHLALLRITMIILLLLLFHSVSAAILILHGHEYTVAGYQFFPYMIVTMLAVFPLTLLNVLSFTLLVAAVEIITQLLRGQFGQVQAVDSLWLLLVLAVVAGWAAVNQLNMLLGLYRQATRDALTSLANRRLVLEQLDTEIGRLPENSGKLSVLLFDLDKFKGFNDNYGHAAGDIVLKEFARILIKVARRKVDLPARFGGEEFLMLLPGMDREEAASVAEQIIAACHATQVRIPSGDKVGFTTSIGVAQWQAGEDHSNLIGRADAALYEAKDSGRDRFVVAG